jgi:hypothetical protein
VGVGVGVVENADIALDGNTDIVAVIYIGKNLANLANDNIKYVIYPI